MTRILVGFLVIAVGLHAANGSAWGQDIEVFSDGNGTCYVKGIRFYMSASVFLNSGYSQVPGENAAWCQAQCAHGNRCSHWSFTKQGDEANQVKPGACFLYDNTAAHDSNENYVSGGLSCPGGPYTIEATPAISGVVSVPTLAAAPPLPLAPVAAPPVAVTVPTLPPTPTLAAAPPLPAAPAVAAAPPVAKEVTVPPPPMYVLPSAPLAGAMTTTSAALLDEGDGSDTGGAGLQWWAILLIIIGVAVVGMLAFFILCGGEKPPKKKNKKTKRAMKDAVRSNSMSGISSGASQREVAPLMQGQAASVTPALAAAPAGAQPASFVAAPMGGMHGAPQASYATPYAMPPQMAQGQYR